MKIKVISSDCTGHGELFDRYSPTSFRTFALEMKEVRTHFHTHELFEIIYVYEGSETVQYIDAASEEIKSLTPGAEQLIIIPKNLHHSTYAKKVKRLDFRFAASDGFRNAFAALGNTPVVLENPLVVSIFELADKIHASADASSASFAFQRDSLLISAILAIEEQLTAQASPFDGRGESAAPVKNEPLNIKAVIEHYVNTSYTDGSGLAAFAESLNVGIRQAENIVKSEMGMTFSQLVTRQKMTAAKELILKTNLSLTEISGELGYYSYSSFFVAFKKFYGCSPKDFERK